VHRVDPVQKFYKPIGSKAYIGDGRVKVEQKICTFADGVGADTQIYQRIDIDDFAFYFWFGVMKNRRLKKTKSDLFLVIIPDHQGKKTEASELQVDKACLEPGVRIGVGDGEFKKLRRIGIAQKMLGLVVQRENLPVLIKKKMGIVVILYPLFTKIHAWFPSRCLADIVSADKRVCLLKSKTILRCSF
jgi:hypothetical protein